MASKGLNKVMLIGRLGGDPEVRYSAAGMAITNINIATNQSTKDRQTGEWVDVTEWHRIVLFDRLAEIAGEYLRKGSQVYVEGRLQTRKWQDQSGQDRWTTEVVANEMQMLGGRSDNASGGYGSGPSTGSEYSPAPQQQAPRPASPPMPAAATTSNNNLDDDVPF